MTTGAIRPLTQKKTGSREFAYFSIVSRDSDRVAYAWFNEQGFYDLRVVPIKGGDPVVLYRNEEAGFIQPASFSPDGAQILTLLFRRDNISQIAMIDAHSGSIKILKSLNWVYPKRMDFSPDGKWIAYDNFARDGAAERDIYLLSTDGARETKLVDSPGDDVFPFFSSDGAAVYFSSDRQGDPGLFAVDVATRKTRLIASNLGRFVPLGLARSGELLYAIRSGGSNLYLAELDLPAGSLTGKPQMVGEGWSPVWSADGSRVAWLGRRTGENFGADARYVAVREPDGAVKSFDTHLAHMERLAWTRNALVISGSDGKGRGGIFSLALLTGAVKPLVADHDAPFTGFPLSEDLYALGPALLRDGKPFMQYASEIRCLAFSPKSGPAVCTPDGIYAGSRLVRKSVASALAWSPDGASILSAEGPELWVTGIASGTSVQLARFSTTIESLSLHPDGKRLLFSSGKAKTEIWSIAP
jgi:Tol biopolymer transport system component